MSSDIVSRTSQSDNELVIIRRRSGASLETPHSGIWKIAYADFMTAMMAFFLVMWLLNAADRQTIKAVASYFNPIKLSDRVSNQKGVHDPEETVAPEKELTDSSMPLAEPLRMQAEFQPSYSDDVLFSNPYGVLERLAAKADTASVKQQPAHRDPFEPVARLMGTRVAAQESTPQVPERTTVAETQQLKENEVKPPKEIAEEVRADLKNLLPKEAPSVEVTETAEGIMISLTDESNFGMFAIASAEPRPELVVLMEKMAQILNKFPGPIIVRGHTDGRPFRSGTYDNWRLSSARAHMAYFMLVRGGVDERRFERIEGHADRSLKVVDDPEAAENRRIEILLRRVGSS